MAALFEALRTTPGRRRLVGTGREARDDWVDRVAADYDFRPSDRRRLVDAIYDTRRQAAESALQTELQRSGVIRPDVRDRAVYHIHASSPEAAKLRRRAEQQADLIIGTDRQFREQWAVRMKAADTPMTRRQVAESLRQELEARGQWKQPSISEEEWHQAENEAVMDFYAETGIADPDADRYWHFVGPLDNKTCDICEIVMADNPYTRDGLSAALAAAGAMAAESGSAHPHCRHKTAFRPPQGTFHKADNRDAALSWAIANGRVQDAETGKFLPMGRPSEPPRRVRTRHPERISPELLRAVCGVDFGKACIVALVKWALRQSARVATQLCSDMDDQVLGAAGESLVLEMTGARPLGEQMPFDALTDRAAIEIKTKRAEGRRLQLSMKRDARERKQRYADENGLETHTVAVVVHEDRYEVLHRPGHGNFRLEAMEKLAEVDARTGVVKMIVERLPW